MPGERRFFTRACAKKKARDALYEDLFSSVVEKAFLTPVEQEDLSCDEAPINGPLKRKKTKGLTCQCGSLFEKHAQLHEHIVSEHGNDDFVSCKECGIRREAIHRNNVCHICELFVLNLDEHLKTHYQNCTSAGAAMECRHCCRTFTTVKEVREHERVSHEEKVRRKQPQRWKCTYCHLEFLSRHGRDSHVVTHFSNVMDEVWKSLDDMQHEVSAMLNECPICSCVMGSRKSFRMHVIHRHLIIDPETFISKTNVKVEVKEEVEDPLYERNCN